MSYSELSSNGRYVIYEGNSKKEVLDKMWSDALQQGRKENTLLIRVDQEVKKSFFGLKKKRIWKAIAFVKNIQNKKIQQKLRKCDDSDDLFNQRHIENKEGKTFTPNDNKSILINESINKIRTNYMSSSITNNNNLNKELFESLKQYFDNKFCEMKNELFKFEVLEDFDKEKKESEMKEKDIARKNLKWMEEFLRTRDIDTIIIKDIIENITKNTNKDILLNKKEIITFVKNFIRSNIVKETISIENYNFPKNIILVGPTGVGKTVTIVKMAAHLGGLRNKSMRFISIDRYKVGADAQLKYYTEEIMESKFYPIYKEEEFYNLLNKNETYYTFIDTAGKSPKETIVIKELREWLNKSQKDFDIHLVVSSTTKLSDLDLIIEGYSLLNFNHIIATKLDETRWYGSILSMLYKTKKPLSFMTNGQAIPENFEIGNIDRLINETLDYKEE